jgi:hypothetical protein
MQRIGRVNRIGSVAGVIYNYNFYPSQEGDQEIKLYNNSLVKLQGFHHQKYIPPIIQIAAMAAFAAVVASACRR